LQNSLNNGQVLMMDLLSVYLFFKNTFGKI
jgi:hypothetical protein